MTAIANLTKTSGKLVIPSLEEHHHQVPLKVVALWQPK